MRTTTRHIVAALLVAGDGKILIGRKDPQKGGVYGDAWVIPGGGIKASESQLGALRREVAEELGIDISRCETKLVDDTGEGVSPKRLKTGEKVQCQMRFAVYQVFLNQVSKEVKLKLTSDLDEVVWVRVEDLGTYKLSPPALDLFTKLGYLKSHER